MNDFSNVQINDAPVAFWDDMIKMEKELPLEVQLLLYKTVKKMHAIELANKADNTNHNFHLSEVLFDDLLLQIANKK